MYSNKSLTIPGKGIMHNNGHPLSQGLVGAWPLNERGGITAFTLKGTTNLTLTGTITNGFGWSGSPLGAGINLDGTDDYLNAGTTFGNFTSENFTLSLWVLARSFANQPVIVSKGLYNSRGYFFQLTTGGNLIFYTGQSGAQQGTSSNFATNLNVWNHYVVVRNGASISFYINGYYGTNSVSGTHINPTSSSDDFMLGRYTSAGFYLNGAIAFPRVYNRALPGAEAKMLYNTPNIDFMSMDHTRVRHRMRMQGMI